MHIVAPMSVTQLDQAHLFDPGSFAPAEDPALSALFERASSYFSLLAEPSRLRILRAICFEECSVQQVVECTGLPQPNVSRHLALLHRSGVLSRRRSGTSVFYAVSDQTIVELCRIVCSRLAMGLGGRD